MGICPVGICPVGICPGVFVLESNLGCVVAVYVVLVLVGGHNLVVIPEMDKEVWEI